MANLKTFSGFPIQNLSSDPVPFAQAKTNDPYAGTWSSGGDLNTARFIIGGAGSSNSAALAFGGRTPAPADVALTENYNGTAWTEVGDLPAAKSYAAGAGTSTAALSIGGSSPAVPATSGKTESWNGSSWTEITALGRGPTSPQSTTYGAGSGSTTSALFYASDEAGNANARTESWNGSSWTELADQNTARSYAGGVGTSNSSAIMMGGMIYPPSSAKTEVWDGSSWTEVGDLNQARMSGSVSSQGSTTLALFYSGRLYPPNASSALTESWDGTSWTEVNDLSTARRSGSSGGTATSAILGGGSTSGSSPGHVATTEEWAFSGIPPTAPAAGYSDAIVGQMYYNSTSGQFKAIKNGGAPIGTWGSSANLNTARGDGLGGFGTTSLAGVAGGDTGVPGDSWVANTEIYNGSSWSEVADLNTAGYYMQGTAGTSTASITAGRRTSGNTDNVESWNGSSWTEVAEINTARRGAQSAQPASAVSAFLIFGGYTTTQLAVTESWNGSAWTETTDMNTAKYAFGGGGAGPSDAIACGGQGPPGGNSTEIWNGSSWTEVAEMNASKIEGASAGISTLLMYGGGNNPGATGLETCEVYNGSSWSEVNDLADGGNGASCHIGTATDCFFAGGIPPTTPNAASASTEHFLAADFAINTVTTS